MTNDYASAGPGRACLCISAEKIGPETRGALIGLGGVMVSAERAAMMGFRLRKKKKGGKKGRGFFRAMRAPKVKALAKLARKKHPIALARLAVMRKSKSPQTRAVAAVVQTRMVAEQKAEDAGLPLEAVENAIATREAEATEAPAEAPAEAPEGEAAPEGEGEGDTSTEGAWYNSPKILVPLAALSSGVIAALVARGASVRSAGEIDSAGLSLKRFASPLKKLASMSVTNPAVQKWAGGMVSKIAAADPRAKAALAALKTLAPRNADARKMLGVVASRNKAEKVAAAKGLPPAAVDRAAQRIEARKGAQQFARQTRTPVVEVAPGVYKRASWYEGGTATPGG
jgi:hypothetical protein